MSWLDAFTGRTAAMVDVPRQIWPQVEAWTTPNHLEAIVWADILGLDSLPPSRAEAMAVPAVARARHLITSTIANLPLRAYRGADQLPDAAQPTWMYATDTNQPPWHRMAWTIDDILFFGLSLWQVELGADGLPLRCLRVPWEAWDIDLQGRVVDQDGQPMDPALFRVIFGPHEGILTFGKRTIRTAALLERSVVDVAGHPFRLELHQTTDDILDAAERRALVAEAKQALTDNAGVLFTNKAIETKDHGQAAETLLIEGRNASAVDVARLVSIPAALIDANTTGASLSYETQAGRNQQFADYSLKAYYGAVAARLSMDDILPRGQRAVFDTTELTTPLPSPAGPTTLD